MLTLTRGHYFKGVATSDESSKRVIKAKQVEPLVTSPSLQSLPSLATMIAPPRNKSYLSRALSSDACLIEARGENVAVFHAQDSKLPATDRMDYAQVSTAVAGGRFKLEKTNSVRSYYKGTDK